MKKIISFGAVLLAGALTTGCATSDAAGAPAEPAGLEQGRALYEQISTSLYGTPNDRLAAEKATAARFQGTLADCMKTKGFTYQPAPSEQQNGGPISPGDLDVIADISDNFGLATAKRHQAEVADQLRAYNAAHPVPAEQEAAYGKALGDCTAVASKSEEPFSAPVQGGLMKELTATFREVAKTPAVAAAIAAYSPCMTEAGFTAKNRLHIYQQALDKFPRADLGVAAMEKDPQWAAAVDFETKAAAADAACRQPAQDQALAAAAPRLQTFVTKYAAQLAAADASWAKLSK